MSYMWTKKLGDAHYPGKSSTLCGRPMLGNNYYKERPDAPLCEECKTIHDIRSNTMIGEVLDRVVKRMEQTGDYIVGIESRYYWANDKVKGCLIEKADTYEVLAAQTFSGERDIILREFKTIT